jgi:hypothetical protein
MAAKFGVLTSLHRSVELCALRSVIRAMLGSHMTEMGRDSRCRSGRWTLSIIRGIAEALII